MSYSPDVRQLNGENIMSKTISHEAPAREGRNWFEAAIGRVRTLIAEFKKAGDEVDALMDERIQLAIDELKASRTECRGRDEPTEYLDRQIERMTRMKRGGWRRRQW